MDVILDVFVYYRCKGCGTMDAPSVIDPSDYPPESDCPC